MVNNYGKTMKILFYIIFSLLFLPSCFLNAKKILIINSYHKAYPWVKSYNMGLRKELSDSYKIENFYMDTKRLPESMHEKQAELAWEKYLSVKPDLVILADDNALKYLGGWLANTKTPVVFLGVNNNPRYYNLGNEKNITGILERPLYRRSILQISKFIKTKKVLVLFDSGTTANVIKDELFLGRANVYLYDIIVELFLVKKIKKWKEIILNSKSMGFDFIIVGLYHTILDKNGKHVDSEEVIQWTSKHTPIPIFAFWDFAVGREKAIGGLVLHGATQGAEAGRLANKILGERVSPSKIIIRIGDKGKYLFSRSQLEKYNLTLPEGISRKAEFVD